MSTIAYDKPVRDMIAGLNATGHVTHTQHRKDMVTLHHNGGRLSHDGVLNVWKVRPASAHFNVDGVGSVAQFVKANEYAWATGSTEGNRRSISIEMCNSAVGGNWPVYEAAWYEAARLSGWIFAKIIGVRPTSTNLVVHHRWKATACAGPYIDTKLGSILQLANASYEYFAFGPPPIPPQERGEQDMTTRLVRGDSLVQVPGKDYNYGMLNFLVHFDPMLEAGAERRYMRAGGAQRVLEQIQGGADVVAQSELDKIPYVDGGEPPEDVFN